MFFKLSLLLINLHSILTNTNFSKMFKLVFFISLISFATCEEISPQIKTAFRKDQNVGIIGGNEAKPHAYPYQVGLKMDYGTYISYCGGSLITNYSILTAAHCLNDDTYVKPRSVTVYLGFHEFPDSTTETGQIVKVTDKDQMKVHEKWNRAKLINDIAIVTMPKKADIGSNIAITPLDFQSNKHVGEGSVVTGWGLTKDNEQFTKARKLRYVFLNVMDNKDCLAKFGGSIQSTHLCTSPIDKSKTHVGTCSGDSGGPLVGTNGQIGIVSFGYEYCDDANFPSVFTRVSEYEEWIEKNSSKQIHSTLYISVVLFSLVYLIFN